jgi:hypothetical protein
MPPEGPTSPCVVFRLFGKNFDLESLFVSQIRKQYVNHVGDCVVVCRHKVTLQAVSMCFEQSGVHLFDT